MMLINAPNNPLIPLDQRYNLSMYDGLEHISGYSMSVATDVADQSCPACLGGCVLGALRRAGTPHHYVMKCDEYIPFRRSPKFRDLFTGLGADALYEFYARNDPNLIVKFLLCCREKKMERIHSLELGCRT